MNEERGYHSLPLLLGNNEDIFGRVHGTTKDLKSERRDTPALDQLLARDWRYVKESKAVTLHKIGGKVSTPEVPDCTPTQGLAWGQFEGALHHVNRMGPLVCIPFT